MSGSKNSQSWGESRLLLSTASDAKLIRAKCLCFLTDGKSQKAPIGIIRHGAEVAACCWHMRERASSRARCPGKTMSEGKIGSVEGPGFPLRASYCPPRPALGLS